MSIVQGEWKQAGCFSRRWHASRKFLGQALCCCGASDSISEDGFRKQTKMLRVQTQQVQARMVQRRAFFGEYRMVQAVRRSMYGTLWPSEAEIHFLRSNIGTIVVGATGISCVQSVPERRMRKCTSGETISVRLERSSADSEGAKRISMPRV